MLPNFFNLYEYKNSKEQNLPQKYFLSLFNLDRKIFFVEVVNNLDNLNSEELKYHVQLKTTFKQFDYFCNLNLLYFSEIKEFNNELDNIHSLIIEDSLTDFCKFEILNMINERINSQNNYIDLVYLKNKNQNLDLKNN
ncbi:hypothetical protein [Mycoplasmopsis cricetuli]|uniref:hypothetical protein n=1 Tax=Mycoplasmopsis cricetuli TaxID=171283 RepID=UPI00046F2E1F|nr:hypothetical protein [Mycoplasmopsis cricetuli]